MTVTTAHSILSATTKDSSDTTSDSSTLSSLPEEIVARVLHYVDTPTVLIALSHVSRAYYHRALDPLSYHSVVLSSLANIFGSHLLCYYLPRWKLIVRMDLSGCSSVTDRPMLYVWLHCHSLRDVILERCLSITDQTFQHLSVAKCRENVRLININQCDALTSQALIEIGNHCPSLTSLSLIDCDINDRALIQLHRCPSLTTLVLNSCDVSDTSIAALSSLSSMRTLSLLSCYRLTNKSLLSLRQHCRSLQHLDVTQLSSINDRGMAELIPHIPLLETMVLSKCIAITSQTLLLLSQYCLLLTVIDFSWCQNLSDEGFVNIASLSRLSMVRLDRCSKLTDKALLLLSSLPMLQSLSVSSCHQLTDTGIGYVSNKCLRLRSLNISGCYKVTRQQIRALPDTVAIKI